MSQFSSRVADAVAHPLPPDQGKRQKTDGRSSQDVALRVSAIRGCPARPSGCRSSQKLIGHQDPGEHGERATDRSFGRLGVGGVDVRPAGRCEYDGMFSAI
jgi:hypothetical protein